VSDRGGRRHSRRTGKCFGRDEGEAPAEIETFLGEPGVGLIRGAKVNEDRDPVPSASVKGQLDLEALGETRLEAWTCASFRPVAMTAASRC
jgi:hypothetical protein